MLIAYGSSLENSYGCAESIRGKRASGSLILACGCPKTAEFGAGSPAVWRQGNGKKRNRSKQIRRKFRDEITRAAYATLDPVLGFGVGGHRKRGQGPWDGSRRTRTTCRVELRCGQVNRETTAFPPEIAAQVERIYRRVYLLPGLKRDEMVRDGQQELLDRVHKSAHESQTAILK